MTETSGPRAPSTDAGDLPAVAYERMSRVLRAGLLVAVAILGGSIIAYLFANPGETAAEVISSNPILRYLGLDGLAAGLASGSVEAYLTLGLLVLLATPLLRVASGFYYFQRGGEKVVAAVTATVLVLLLFGILVLGPALR